jgi:hypothetical protein
VSNDDFYYNEPLHGDCCWCGTCECPDKDTPMRKCPHCGGGTRLCHAVPADVSDATR